MSEIVLNARRYVAGVVRPVAVDEIAGKVGAKVLRLRNVRRIVTGVEMRNTHAGRRTRAPYKRERRFKLGMRLIAKPVVVRQTRIIPILRIWFARLQAEPEFNVVAD